MKWILLIILLSLASCQKEEASRQESLSQSYYGNYQHIGAQSDSIIYKDSIIGSLAFSIYDSIYIGSITERGPFGEIKSHPIRCFKRDSHDRAYDFHIRSESLLLLKSNTVTDSVEIKAHVRSDSSIFSLIAATKTNIDDSGRYALFYHCLFVGNYGWNNEITFKGERADFQFCIFQGVDCSVWADTVVISDCKLNEGLSTLSFSYMAKIRNIEGVGKLALRCSNVRSVAQLNDVDIDMLDLPDDGSVLITFDTAMAYPKKLLAYKKLLGRYADIPDLRMIYDIENRRMQHLHDKNYFTNWVQENWNYYGYNKYMIFRNAFVIMGFFFLINLFVYPKLLENVYVITELKAVNNTWKSKGRHKLLRWNFYFFHCLIYTAFVFWSLKLDIEKLKFKYLLAAFWIIAQYIMGIICLAYIANVIITQ